MPPAAKVRKKRVFLVDDHPIVREGLTQLIDREQDLTVCGEAASVTETLEALETARAHILIADISLAGTDGIELIKNCKAQQPGLPILVLSMHEETVYAERVLRAGARGYIMKQEATEKVLGAIRRILSGEIYVSNQMTARMLERVANESTPTLVSSVDRLSDRELEVFRLIGRGQSTREIGRVLNLSVKTVESYRARLKEKLGLQNGQELLRRALHWVEYDGQDQM